MASNGAVTVDTVQDTIDRFQNETDKLHGMLAHVGTRKDTDVFRQQLKAQGEKTKDLSKTINRDLKTLHSECNARIKMSKLKKSFESALMQYRRAQKELEKHERQILQYMTDSLPQDSPLGLSSGQSYEENNIQMSQQQSQAASISLDFREITIEDAHRKQEAIEDIERDVADIQEMFKDLATLVTEQGEMIDDIENNITLAKVAVESGHEDLTKAEKSQRSSRKYLCYACLVVLIILVIVISVVFA